MGKNGGEQVAAGFVLNKLIHTMTLRQQITKDFQDANPTTIAELLPLKYKYRNLCSFSEIDYLAKHLGYLPRRHLKGYREWKRSLDNSIKNNNNRKEWATSITHSNNLENSRRTG